MNRAKCNNIARDYTCTCTGNYEGTNCEGEYFTEYKTTLGVSRERCSGLSHRGFMHSTIIFNLSDRYFCLSSHALYGRLFVVSVT